MQMPVDEYMPSNHLQASGTGDGNGIIRIVCLLEFVLQKYAPIGFEIGEWVVHQLE